MAGSLSAVYCQPLKPASPSSEGGLATFPDLARDRGSPPSMKTAPTATAEAHAEGDLPRSNNGELPAAEGSWHVEGSKKRRTTCHGPRGEVWKFIRTPRGGLAICFALVGI